MLESARGLHQRAQELSAKLPAPPAEELEHEVPRGFYFTLGCAVSFVAEDGLVDLVRVLEHATSATRKSLRHEWLAAYVSDGLGLPVTDELVPRLVSSLCDTPSGGTAA